MTSYLLDTNIVSETRKQRVDAGVASFLMQRDPSTILLSVLTLGELRRGAAKMSRSDPNGGASIASWIDGIEAAFADRILVIDAKIARCWGEISSGRSRPVADTLIAATALVRTMTLVTRNAKDFAGLDLPVLDPFAPGPTQS